MFSFRPSIALLLGKGPTWDPWCQFPWEGLKGHPQSPCHCQQDEAHAPTRRVQALVGGHDSRHTGGAGSWGPLLRLLPCLALGCRAESLGRPATALQGPQCGERTPWAPATEPDCGSGRPGPQCPPQAWCSSITSREGRGKNRGWRACPAPGNTPHPAGG